LVIGWIRLRMMISLIVLGRIAPQAQHAMLVEIPAD